MSQTRSRYKELLLTDKGLHVCAFNKDFIGLQITRAKRESKIAHYYYYFK